MTDTQRYHALKKWLIDNRIVDFVWSPPGDSEPFVMGNEFHGETFEAAVDTLSVE